ncbi:poly(A) polymerase, partial [Oleiphilus sp. HI0125]
MAALPPSIISRDEHPVSRKHISPNALKVLYRLENAGFKAYLVGGCIRDLLLGIQPKDFDIATNAHPEQVHKLFSNSRLIGRRFKLVHVLFGREIIEVATFRGSNEDSSAQQQTAEGMLTRDNVYGTIEEDSIRRDFTANALYYSATDFCIYDYCDALTDIKAHSLKLIGEPEERYREDPVRMLRAIRFSEKLNFDIEQKAEQSIHELSHLMSMVAPARLFDEIIKLFVSGYGAAIFERLLDTGLFKALFPSVAHTIDKSQKEHYLSFIRAALINTDKRIAQEKPITPAFLYASLLWPDVHRIWGQKIAEGLSDFPALQQAGHQAIEAQLPHIMIPKRFILMMREIWEMQ